MWDLMKALFLILSIFAPPLLELASAKAIGVVVDCDTRLNVRSSKSLQSSVIHRLPCQGDENVEFLDEDPPWKKIRIDNKTGYVWGKYLDVLETVNTVNSGLEEIARFGVSQSAFERCLRESSPEKVELNFTSPGLIDPFAPQVSTHDKLKENFAQAGGDPVALEQALCFLERNQDKTFLADRSATGHERGLRLNNKRYVTINDLTKDPGQKRLFVLDLETGEVHNYLSSHGGGTSEHGKNLWGRAPRYFSNEADSNLSPSGFFLTGNRYTPGDKDWNYGMRLHGVQKGLNDESYYRGIVLHSFKYTPNGRTQGCVGVKDERTAREIMDMIKSGEEGTSSMTETYTDQEGNEMIGYPQNHSLFYNFSPYEKEKRRAYCGNDPAYELMLKDDE